MPHVTTISSRVRDFTGGVDSFDVEALTVRSLIRELDTRFPGLGAHVEESMAIAIDGEIFQDAWLEPIPPDSEILQLRNVFLSPHVGWATGDPIRPFFTIMVDELDRFFQGHETWYDLTPASKANRTGNEPPSKAAYSDMPR